MSEPLPSYRVQPTPELFRNAATVLRERGLSRGKFLDPDGSGAVCALGACAVAGGYEPDEGGYMVPIHNFLAEMLRGGRPDPFSFLTIVALNDAAEDVEEMATFLETAADYAGEVKE